MVILSNLLKNIGANTLTKFTSLVNSNLTSEIPSVSSIKVPSVVNGISYATDVKKRMAEIEWSRGFSWDVYITPEPPAPFNKKQFGLPIIDVQTDFVVQGVPGYLSLANTNYSYPERRDLYSIKLTSMDDETGTMERYFEQWYHDVYRWNDDKGCTQYLDKSVRQLRLTKLNSKKQEVFTREYLVFPMQSVGLPNNSTGNVRTFSIDLMIAGYVGATSTAIF